MTPWHTHFCSDTFFVAGYQGKIVVSGDQRARCWSRSKDDERWLACAAMLNRPDLCWSINDGRIRDLIWSTNTAD